MEKSYNLRANRALFKLSDRYSHEKIEFDNSLGENLFGKLILHRVENIVYMNLLRDNSRKLGAYEKFFKMVYERELEQVSVYEEGLEHVCNIMKEASFQFSLLKGAFLIPKLYEKGMRRSNDIDILVAEKDIDECQNLLLKNGFIQGEVKDGVVHKATRKEIVLSRMNYGETIPFCKPYGKNFIFVDLNFSLDYKPASDAQIINDMLKNTVDIPWRNTIIKTLNISDFIIHLCMHLYKEATTLDWVKRRKDLNLYKFNDLNVMFHECVNDEIYQELLDKILCYGVQKECYYALFNATQIYSDLLSCIKYSEMLSKIEPEDSNYLQEIVDPENKKVYMHNMSFEEWFACEDRVGQLYEV